MNDACGSPLPLPDIEACRALRGGAALTSPWMQIDQAMVDRFADATLDHQWIHVDAQRAASESPYGCTIAHGFLSLSLLSHLVGQVFSYPGRKTSVNYGFDRVRFTAAVPVGARLRASVKLAELTDIAPQEARITWDVALEIAGSMRPALVARWLVQMRY